MPDRAALQQDKGELVLKRKMYGMKNPSIEVDRGFNIVPRTGKTKDGNVTGEVSEYTLVARKSTRTGDISSRASKLKSCKGLSGCDFVECSYEAFGKIPPNLMKACPTFNINKR